jgi:hypothetical protein
MVLGRIEIEHRVIGNVTRCAILAFIVNESAQCGGVANHAHVQCPRGRLDDDVTSPGYAISESLAHVRRHDVAQLDLAAGVLEDATFDHDALIREMNLVRAPPQGSGEENGQTGTHEDYRERDAIRVKKVDVHHGKHHERYRHHRHERRHE